MTKYEIMFIVSPTLEEKAIKDLAKEFEKILTGKGAKIVKTTDWGMRELAYEVKKHKTGHYFIYNIEAKDAKPIDEFRRLALINENMLRHIIIKEEE